MVHKKTDARYALVRGHIPKVLQKRFRNYCVEKEIDYSQGLEDILTIFFQLLDKGDIPHLQTISITIADLIKDWNLEKLAKLSEVKIENLQAIRAGERPTNDDLIGLGIILCKEDGEPWTTDELIEIRDRTFYYLPDLSKQRESPPIS
ncbi:hypothetical protein [Lyngbya aestuarii]|uniref:hypothetical protein n=1 Tax=Lyngbya aestuarii TaxID=118322 RepID=UPI00403D76EC